MPSDPIHPTRPTELIGERDQRTPAGAGEPVGDSIPGDGTNGDGIPEVLFLCVHNAGRSQMAAAILEHRSHGRIRVRSAGSQPADRLNPAVVEVMAEWGLDISHEFPKPLTGDAVEAADVVVTM